MLIHQAIKKKDVTGPRNEWKENEAYANDAYRLLTGNKELCLKCHSIGSIKIKPAASRRQNVATNA